MELTDVLPSEHRKEMKSQYMADRYLYMDTIADTLDKKVFSCSVNVTWHSELHEAIEEIVDVLEPDLVIKRISANSYSLTFTSERLALTGQTDTRRHRPQNHI
jgi:universal stress protein E